jgi:hypothetical protein
MNAAKISPEAKEAIANFQAQLGELFALSLRGVIDGEFETWHKATLEIFSRYLPDTHYDSRFADINFQVSGYLDKRRDPFAIGCEKAQAVLEGAIEHIDRFGLKIRKPKPESR